MRRPHLRTALALCVAHAGVLLGTVASPSAHAPVRVESPPAPPRAALCVVVAAASPLEALSRAQLRRLYVGVRTTDPAGTPLIPLNQPLGSAERVAFDRRVLGLAPDEVGRFWVDRKIRGEAAPPRAITPPATLVRLVAAVPGALGYVRCAQVGDGVRVLSLDGVAPQAPGYLLADEGAAP